MENFIEQICKEVYDLNQNLPEYCESASQTNLLSHKLYDGLQIKITVGYNLEEDDE